VSLLYRGLIRVAIGVAPLAARGNRKIREGLRERAGVLDRFAAWAHRHREPTRPLLWLHAASWGEARQAEAVLRILKSRHPDWQVVVTRFSPSASGLGWHRLADFADVLPWDRPGDVTTALDLLRPAALVFCKLDLWPELALQAARRTIPTGLIAATVSPAARRLGWPARSILRPGYEALEQVGAIGPDDAERLIRLGVRPERITLTGDPRCDSAVSRADSIAPTEPLRQFARSGPALVAGSTWPPDEDRLLAALGSVRHSRPDAGLILVPHEPTPEHLDRIDRRAEQLGLPNPRRLSHDPPAGPGQLLVVDRVGILPTFYADATIAYVGGGFGTTGLHSVLEPAAAGIPVLVGPRWQGSPDAGGLLAARAAAVIEGPLPDWLAPGERSSPDGELAALWLALLRHPEDSRAAGERGRRFVESGLGAAARNAEIVEELMRVQGSGYRVQGSGFRVEGSDSEP
jgi:3-deoxy-D-manno-octulosonic-acid transferase